MLRHATTELHQRVERGRWMQALLSGRADRPTCVQYLRDLHALYQALEGSWPGSTFGCTPRGLDLGALFRAPRLTADLDEHAGAAWITLPMSGAVQRMVDELNAATAREGDALAPVRLAYLYVRYLGDLHGGQILSRAVGRVLGHGDAKALRYFDFGPLERVKCLIAQLRQALDQWPLSPARQMAVVREAQAAFERHAQWFDELTASRSGALPRHASHTLR